MLAGGDELGRTQRGNNNAYCQDNELSWFDWEHADEALLAFTSKLVAFYRKHPTFRRRGWFQSAEDIVWVRPDGGEMSIGDWQSGKAVGVFLDGEGLVARDQRGQRIVDASFFVAVNASPDPVQFAIPPRLGQRWERVFDTETGFDDAADSAHPLFVPPRAVAVFQRLES